MPRLDVSAAQVGDLDRAEPGLDPLFNDAPDFGRSAQLVVRLDVFGEVAIGDLGNGALAALFLAIAGRIVAVTDRGLLVQCLLSCPLRCQRAVASEAKPALAAALRPVFEDVDFATAWQAAEPKAR